MKHSLFIADLHLCESRPPINAAFSEFLRGPASAAEALYILGDLFEYWPGDDAASLPFYAGVTEELALLSSGGVQLYLMHGNRDFLLGVQMASMIRARLLKDPHPVDLYGTQSVLMHGDTLCTDDTAYLEFRATVRDQQWQRAFLATPLDQRIAAAEALRRQSNVEKQAKSMEIMDVNAAAVSAVFRDCDCTRLIHGHTHRRARHRLNIDGVPRERWVLNDWYEKGGYLRCDATGCGQIWL